MSSSNCCFLTCILGFSRGKSGGLVFASLSEFSTVYCDPHRINYRYTYISSFFSLPLTHTSHTQHWAELPVLYIAASHWLSILYTDILKCKVKWALGRVTTNKASEGDGIPVELFQILKDDAVKVLQSICQQILKTQQWPQDWKRSVFIQIPKKGNAKECSNYRTIALISQASKVMLKILQDRL